ncbi:MAG: enoyl-CoA hydratase-related protein [Pseudomonadota bacterium]
MELETLKLDIIEGVARLTMIRKNPANALGPQFFKDLSEAMVFCGKDDSVRVILLSAGEGPVFSAGGDLAAFAKFGDDLPAAFIEMGKDLNPAMETLVNMDAPLVTVVNGVAAGAGLSLVLASNFVFATDNAKFTVAYTGAGLTPDASSTYFLPRLVGVRRAEELIVTNRQFSAQEAAEWGIVNYVVEEEELMSKAEAFAARLAKGPTKAFGAAKRLLMSSFDTPFAEQLELEVQSISRMCDTNDGKEGIAAFLEKRRPVFSGQ